jgi:hypothetical protein
MRKAYGILDGKSEGKKPLGRPMSRWKDNKGCFKHVFPYKVRKEMLEIEILK